MSTHVARGTVGTRCGCTSGVRCGRTRAWTGTHLPAGRGRQLAAYGSWCNAVEGNATFYAPPAPSTVAAWAEQTDPSFRFVFKLPRVMTHERRLRVAPGRRRRVRRVARPVGDGPRRCAVQLPPSFGPADLPSLRAFLRDVPDSHRYAVELRHPAFFESPSLGEEVAGIVAAVGGEWTTFDTTTMFAVRPVSAAEREAWGNKPRATGRWLSGIIRWCDTSAATIRP